MEAIFKEGDKVYLYPLGWGDIQYKSDYDYSIYFQSIEDTRYIGGDVRRLLSFTEYTLEGFSQLRPEELPNRGDVVWIKEDEDQYFWQIGHFFKKSDNRYLVSQGRPDGWSISGVVMTTKNPYANEHN